MSISPTSAALRDSIAPFTSFYNGPIAAALERPGVSNFAFGNPNEMPLPGYVAALHAHLEPKAADWFAYKLSEPSRRPRSPDRRLPGRAWTGIRPTWR